jgi:hypothetical protein
MIGDCEDSVKTLRRGEVGYEIHGHHVKGECLWLGGNGMKRDFWAMGGQFGGLADSIALDICRNERALVWPPIVLGNRLQGSVDARVSDGWIVMVGAQYLPSQKVVCHDNQSGPMAPHTVQSLSEWVDLGPLIDVSLSLKLGGYQLTVPASDVGKAEAEAVKKKGTGEDYNLFVVPFAIVIVRLLGKWVGLHSFAWFMNEDEVVFH